MNEDLSRKKIYQNLTDSAWRNNRAGVIKRMKSKKGGEKEL